MRTIIAPLVAGAMLLGASKALARPATPHPIQFRQPDGTVINVRLKGDERTHWFESLDGRLVVKDRAGGRFLYAVRNRSGAVNVTHLSVGVDDAAARKQVPLHNLAALPMPEKRPPPLRRRPGLGAAAQAAPVAATGEVPMIVLLARFSDQEDLADELPTKAEFEALFNTDQNPQAIDFVADGASGSVTEYYNMVSSGQLRVTAIVSDWLALPLAEADYGADDVVFDETSPASGGQRLAQDAVQAAEEAGFDFGPGDGDNDGFVDLLLVVHSGFDQAVTGVTNQIWSHQFNLMGEFTTNDTNSNGQAVKVFDYATVPARRGSAESNPNNSIVRIGVIAHEALHLFGLPDLYDVSGLGQGIGLWGVMGAGSFGGDLRSEQRPVHPCAWSKVELGWVSPTVLSAGQVNIPQVQGTNSPEIFRYDTKFATDEFLLIANRQKEDFDQDLPFPGLLVWHIDNNLSGSNSLCDLDQLRLTGECVDTGHFRVALVQADYSANLESDMAFGNGNQGDDSDPFPGMLDMRAALITSYFRPDSTVEFKDISDAAPTMSMVVTTSDAGRPVALIDGPHEADLNEFVSFDAMASMDDDGTIVAYRWDLDDFDGVDFRNAGSTGPTASFTYAAAGVHTVNLMATDDDGRIGFGTFRIAVGSPPVADIQVVSKEPFVVDIPIDLSAFGSTDFTDPSGANLPQDFFWDFDPADGVDFDNPDATGIFVDASYPLAGTHTVTLKVVGHSGRTDTTQIQLLVFGAQPVADAGPDLTVEAGQKVTFSGGNSFDRVGTIVAYKWDFDNSDGLDFTTPDAQGVVVEHIFPPIQGGGNDQIFQVTLQVTNDRTDELGQPDPLTDLDSVTVTVKAPSANQPPIAAAGADLQVNVGERFSLDGSGSSDPDGTLVNFLWFRSPGPTDAIGGGAVLANQVLDNSGTFTYTLVVGDDQGATASDTVIVTGVLGETGATGQTGQPGAGGTVVGPGQTTTPTPTPSVVFIPGCGFVQLPFLGLNLLGLSLLAAYVRRRRPYS